MLTRGILQVVVPVQVAERQWSTTSGQKAKEW